MKILITGATGLVGSPLCHRLVLAGHELVILSRSPGRAHEKLGLPGQYLAWNAEVDLPPPAALEGLDAVIHLAGEPIAAKRWTAEQKTKIRDSRIVGTRHLAEGFARIMGQKPKILIAASAIGYYGDRGEEQLTEASAAGKGFLPELCVKWEQESAKILGEDARGVFLRISMVLSREGGALEKLYSPFRAGVGGPIGSGKYWMSWIHIDDIVELIVTALENPAYRGAINAVAPESVRNHEFSTALGRALKRPALVPVPPAILQALFGELSQVILSSQHVVPAKLQELGFRFKNPTLQGALAAIYPEWFLSGVEELVVHQWVPKKVDEVFPFFSDEKNLEALTPPWLGFHVLGKSTPEIREGTRIDYRLKIKGVPVRWQSQITEWHPGEGFMDRQTRGPYSKWEHTHLFTPVRGGTLLTDRVRFKVPAGELGRLIAGARVRNDVRGIFKYRAKKIEDLFSR